MNIGDAHEFIIKTPRGDEILLKSYKINDGRNRLLIESDVELSGRMMEIDGKFKLRLSGWSDNIREKLKNLRSNIINELFTTQKIKEFDRKKDQIEFSIGQILNFEHKIIGINKHCDIRIPLRDKNGKFKNIDISRLLDKKLKVIPVFEFNIICSSLIFMSMKICSMIITEAKVYDFTCRQFDSLVRIENQREFILENLCESEEHNSTPV